MKILFNGFRHSHIDGLYRNVLQRADFEIVGCVEPNAKARKNAEARLGAVFSDLSYDQWLNSDVDVVAIGCAYGERGDAIIKALGAGKHVIADKPICTDLKQLKQIEKLCADTGCKLICMLDLRYLPQSLSAEKLIKSKKLGAVCNISFNGQHCLDYGNRPSWYFEPGMHGGTINDLAIHGIDLVRMLTGLEFSIIDAARTWNAYADQEPQFPDCALFMARLENGAGVMADISYSAPKMAITLPTYWEFRIWCERGLLTFNYRDEQVTLYEQGVDMPQFIQWDGARGSYLEELLSEIRTGSSSSTSNVIKSTTVALQLQEKADKESVI